MAGSTSKQEQKTISFSFNNQFQAKVINSEKQFLKIDLFTWNISSNYNFAADSLKLSPIRSSIRTTLPGGFKLDLSGVDANGFDREMSAYYHWYVSEGTGDTNTDSTNSIDFESDN